MSKRVNVCYEKQLKLHYDKKSNLVFKAKKDLTVIGRIKDKQFVSFDFRTLELCKEYGLKPDESKIEKKEIEKIESKTEDRFHKLSDIIQMFTIDGDLLLKKLKENGDSFKDFELKLSDVGKNLFSCVFVDIKLDNDVNPLFRISLSFFEPDPFCGKIRFEKLLSLQETKQLEKIKDISFVCKKCLGFETDCKCYFDDVIQYENEENCPICLEKVTNNNRIETLCDHHIHKYCVFGYVTNREADEENVCPLCRETLLSDEVLNENNSDYEEDE